MQQGQRLLWSDGGLGQVHDKCTLLRRATLLWGTRCEGVCKFKGARVSLFQHALLFCRAASEGIAHNDHVPNLLHVVVHHIDPILEQAALSL